MDTKPLIPYEKCETIETQFEIESISTESKDKAWVNTYVNKYSENGSFFIPRQILLQDYNKLFKMQLNKKLLDNFCEKRTFNNKEYLTCKSFIDIENYISETVFNMISKSYDYNATKLDRFLKDYEDISLNNQQQQCLHMMLKENFICVNGYPGVGKSTICDVFVQYSKYKKIHFLAPTGMAVKNIKSKIKVNTTTNKFIEFDTIHKFIHSTGRSSRKNVTYIIDECSMIDTYLFYRLLKAIHCSENEDEISCKIILLGDNNQLPPISAGQPFLYLLQKKLTKYIPQYTLDKIERQGKSQLRDTICNMISDPIKIKIKNFDNVSMFFENVSNYNRESIENIVTKYNLTPENSKFISPSKKYNAGVIKLNSHLKMIYNKPDAEKKGVTVKNISVSKIFHEGDVVLLTKNQPDSHDVNGDFFKIISIDDSSYDEYNYSFHLKKTDDDDEEIRKYSYNDMLDFFELGYACTVHKVQGSQYDSVAIFIDKSHFYQWQKIDSFNLLFTAISRAKKRCIIVGDETLFYIALNNKSEKDNKAPLTTIIDTVFDFFQ